MTSSSEPRFPFEDELFVGIGSNLGDRKAGIEQAVARLERDIGPAELSPLYESEPQLVRDQPWFLNAVARLRTRADPFRLLEILLAIERSLGRDRSVERSKGPRPLDLDMVLYGRRIIDTAELELPHPSYRDRRFVLQPLLDLAPELRDPRDGALLAERLPQLHGQAIYLSHTRR